MKLPLVLTVLAFAAPFAPIHAQEPTPAVAPAEERFPELRRRISQEDDLAVREAALADAMRLLTEGDSKQREHAMEALAETTSVPFDRAPFLPLVRKALTDENAGVRAFALRVVKRFGATIEEDMDDVVARKDDEERYVRGWVAFAMYQLDPTGAHPSFEPTLLELLGDPEPVTLSETCRWLWGNPTSPAVDALLVELSRDPKKMGDVVYFALGTRPYMRCNVAERLMEIAADPTLSDKTRARAAWGVSFWKLDPACAPQAVDAMASWLEPEAKADPKVRYYAVWGLGKLGGEKAEALLQGIVDTPAESAELRRDAKNALERLRAAKAEAAPAAP